MSPLSMGPERPRYATDYTLVALRRCRAAWMLRLHEQHMIYGDLLDQRLDV